MELVDIAMWVNVSSGAHTFCYGFGVNSPATWYSEKLGVFSAWEVK